jgi:hypothetical protein
MLELFAYLLLKAPDYFLNIICSLAREVYQAGIP